MTSKYDRIKSDCKKRNIMWEDPDFQAVQTSVFYYQTPPFTFQWKRIADIETDPAFMNENEYFDIIPGKMGMYKKKCIKNLNKIQWFTLIFK